MGRLVTRWRRAHSGRPSAARPPCALCSLARSPPHDDCRHKFLTDCRALLSFTGSPLGGARSHRLHIEYTEGEILGSSIFLYTLCWPNALFRAVHARSALVHAAKSPLGARAPPPVGDGRHRPAPPTTLAAPQGRRTGRAGHRAPARAPTSRWPAGRKNKRRHKINYRTNKPAMSARFASHWVIK